MRHPSPRLARWLVAPAVLVPTLAVGGVAVPAVAADVGAATFGPPAVVDPGFVRPSLEQAAVVVRGFAIERIGMVDPVVHPAVPVPGDPNRATVDVQNRREDGSVGDGLPVSTVVVRQQFDRWVVESATSAAVSIEVPIGGSFVVIGHDLPVSGRASAWEGTVPIDVVTGEGCAATVIGEGVATAAGMFDAPYATEVPVPHGPAGDGWVIATTTTGTDQGPPAFAVVPIHVVRSLPT